MDPDFGLEEGGPIELAGSAARDCPEALVGQTRRARNRSVDDGVAGRGTLGKESAVVEDEREAGAASSGNHCYHPACRKFHPIDRPLDEEMEKMKIDGN